MNVIEEIAEHDAAIDRLIAADKEDVGAFYGHDVSDRDSAVVTRINARLHKLHEHFISIHQLRNLAT